MPDIQDMMQDRMQFQEALAQMQQGTYKGSGDLIDWSYRDTITLNFNAPNPFMEQSLFVIGRGQVDPVTGLRKSEADTNVEPNTPGIPTGSKQLVQYLKVSYSSVNPINEAKLMLIYNMMKDTTANFKITGKDTQGDWDLLELFNMAFPNVLTPANPGDGSTALTNNRILGVYPLQLPLILASLTSFEFKIRHFLTASNYTDLNDDRLCIRLCGVRGRLS